MLNLNYVMSISVGTSDKVETDNPYEIVFILKDCKITEWSFSSKDIRNGELEGLVKLIDSKYPLDKSP